LVRPTALDSLPRLPFGSHAREKPTPISDVDLAVLLSEAVPCESYLDYRIA